MSGKLKYLPVGLLAAAIWAGAVFFFYQEKAGTLPEGEFTAAQILGEDYERYVHPSPAFSLEYSRGLKASAFNEGDGGQTIVFQGEEKTGFQIFISPYEGGGITESRILQDLPEAIIEEPTRVILNPEAENPTEALIFWSNDPAIGKTREVWFAEGDYIYEITTYAHLDAWLAGLMATWQFLE